MADHLVENICGAMKGVASRIPRGWSNIQSVHIKSTASVALPVYASLPPAPTSLPAVEDRPPSKRVRTGGVSTVRRGYGVRAGVEDFCLINYHPSLALSLPPSLSPSSLSQGRSKAAGVDPEEMADQPSPQLAKKKIRGSRVVSAKMEKALRTGRKRTRNT